MNELPAVVWGQLRDSTIQLAFVLGGILLLARLLKAQPTRLSLSLIFLPVPALLFGFFWPPLITLFSVYTPALILLLLVDGFFLSVHPDKLRLQRALNRKFSIGQENPVLLTLVNNSGQTLKGNIRDAIPAGLIFDQQPESLTHRFELPPFSRQDITYRLFPTRRGRYRFERIHARYRSRLGLLWLTVQDGRSEEIKVIPNLKRVRRLRINASKARSVGELHKRTLGMDGTQFASLRHYFAGDDVRKMAWQATAKLDVPVVQTFEPEVEQPILILIDAGHRMQSVVNRLSKYDHALNAALAFTAAAIDRGDRVGVGIFNNRVLAHVPIGLGRGHFNHMMETLGETEPQAVEPDYEAVMLQFARNLKRRALVIVLTDLADSMTSRSLLRSLHSFTGHHRVMVVAISDEALIRQAAEMPTTTYDACKKGVAMDLAALRQQALAALSKNRQTIVLDTTPDKLDDALLAQYLRLKERSQL